MDVSRHYAVSIATPSLDRHRRKSSPEVERRACAVRASLTRQGDGDVQIQNEAAFDVSSRGRGFGCPLLRTVAMATGLYISDLAPRFGNHISCGKPIG